MLLSFVDRKAVSNPAISSGGSAGTSPHASVVTGEHDYSNPCRSTKCEELCTSLTGTWYKLQHTSTMNIQIHYRYLLALQQGPVEVPFCQIGNPTILSRVGVVLTASQKIFMLVRIYWHLAKVGEKI